MKKVLGIIAAAVVVAALGAGIYFWQVSNKKVVIESILPEGAVFYLRFSDIEKNLNDFRTSKFWQNVSAINVPKLLEKSGIPQSEIEQIKKINARIGAVINSPVFLDFFGQEAALAVYPIDIPLDTEKTDSLAAVKEALSNVIFMTRLKPQAKIAEYMSGLVKDINPNLKISEREYKNHKISVVELPPLGSLAYTSFGNLWVIGIGEKAVKVCIDVEAKSRRPLLDDTVYQQASANFLESSQTAAFVNLKEIVARFKTQMVKAAVQASQKGQGIYQEKMDKVFSNLSGFEAVGFSSIPGQLTQQKLIWFFDKGKMDPKIKKIYSCGPTVNKTINFVPQDVIGYQWNNCIAPGYYWENAKEQMKNAAAQDAEAPSPDEMIQSIENTLKLSIAKDVLPAIGDEAGGYLSDIEAMGSFPLPQLVIFVKINDKTAADKVVAALTSQPGIVLQNDEYGGVPIKYLSVPMVPNLEPAYCFLDNYFLLSSNRRLLQKSIDTYRDPSTSLNESPSFKDVNVGLTDANNSVFYLKSDDLARKLRSVAEWGYTWFQLQTAQEKAFEAGSRKRLLDLKKGLEQKKADLKTTQDNLVSVQAKIKQAPAAPSPAPVPAADGSVPAVPAPAVSPDVTALINQTADLEKRIKNKKEDIDLDTDQLKELEDLTAGFENRQAIDPAIIRFYLDEAVFPILKGLESYPSLGSKMRFVGDDRLESSIYIKVEK